LGSLYQEKRIDFLLKAAQKIVAEKPDFHLLVIGEGPLKHKMVKAAARYPWLRYIGGVVGRDKAIYLSMADVFLNPGMVGLTILDAFAAGEVFVTTNNAKHSPEIDYLVDGENGRMTANNIDAFVAEVVNLLNNPEILARISREAKLASKHYTIENMAENFHNGILQALAVPRVFRS
jgi:glycosyltransferase involved in cell wall biosynthesis